MTGLNLTGLDGKVAVVTGAGRMKSIGRDIAVELAKAGADVVLTGTGRPPELFPDDEKAAGWRDIASVAEEIEAAGRKALPLVSDVADEAAVRDLLAQTLSELGRVDFVVNNAGAARGAGPRARRGYADRRLGHRSARQPAGRLPGVEDLWAAADRRRQRGA